jgi:UDPglucose--hexose-1-phosphate uridylyltransferase
LPDLRKDPVTGRWVIISTDRSKRPRDFSREQVIPTGGRFCPFCPGHEARTPPEILSYRSSGGPNEPGWSLRVVPNKFPALRIEGDLARKADGLHDRMNGVGAHEVIIESPDHLGNLGNMSEKHVADIFFAFRDRVLDLRKDHRLRYVLLFKNHGEGAGASLEHTHSQLIALPVVPKRVLEEIDGSLKYFQFRERCVFCDIVEQEVDANRRLVFETEHFVVLCPYAPRFPFETWIVPRRHESHFEKVDAASIHNLGWVMRTLIGKMDKVLEMPPYNAIIHTAPLQEGGMPHYHWHVEVMPKLTKVAGFEWGSGFYINPTPPEEAAAFLKDAVLG